MINILLFAVALLIAGAAPAHADPVSAIATVLGGGAFATAVARIIVGVALNVVSSLLQKNAAKSDSEIDVSFEAEIGDDTPLTFTLGKYATAGKRKYIGSWGANNRYITEVIEISSLPQGLAGMWVDDEPGEILWGEEKILTEEVVVGYETQEQGRNGPVEVPIYETRELANLGHPLTNKQNGPSERYMWIRLHNGTQTTADDLLLDAFGDDPDYPWDASMIGTGKTYVVMTTLYDSERMTSYPTWLFEPEPLPLYDPRKDTTAGGSGSHRWGDRSTYEATTNAAVVAYNVARGIYYGNEWVFGGKNLDAWRLPNAAWVAAMNECDAAITLDSGDTEPAFRCGVEISTDMYPRDVLEEIGAAANMRFAVGGGMIKPVVGVPGAAVLTISDDDILITEGQSFQPFKVASETFNALGATYPEPEEKWASKDAPEYVDADATADDGGRYLPTSLSYAAAPYANQVQRLMRAQMRDYRRMRAHQFQLPPDAYHLEAFDLIAWNSGRNGYDSKMFMVEQLAKRPGMNISVTLREVEPGDYDWSSAFELPYTITPPVVPIVLPQQVPGFAATASAVQDGNSRNRLPAIIVSCDGGQVGVTRIRVQIRKSGATDVEFDYTRPYAEPFAWTIIGLAGGTDYEVSARLESDLAGISLWTDWTEVTTPDVQIEAEDISAVAWQAISDDAASVASALIADYDTDTIQPIRDDIGTAAADIAQIEAQVPLINVALGDVNTRIDGLLPGQLSTDAAIDQIEDRLLWLMTKAHTTESLVRDAGVYVSPDDGTVRIAGIDSAEGRISEVEINVDAVASAISLRATYAEVDERIAAAQLDPADFTAFTDLQLRVNQAEIDIDAVEASITSKADTTVVDGIDTRLTTAETDIDALEGQITLKVDTTTFSALETRVSSAEITLGTIDAPSLNLMVKDVRSLTEQIDLTAVNSLQALLDAYQARKDLRRDLAFAQQDLRALVDEDRTAVAELSQTLGAQIEDATALIRSEQSARASADEALGQSITTIEAELANQESDLAGYAAAQDGLTARVADVEGDITSQGQSITSLTSRVGDAESDISGNATAISQLDTRVTSAAGAITSLAQDVTTLQADLTDAEGDIAANAGAVSSLTTRVTSAEGDITSQGQAITSLTSRVGDAETDISGNTSAISQIDTRVTSAEGSITSLSQDVTTLQSDLTDAEGDITANANAVSSLTSRVTDAEGDITSQGQSITSLTSRVGDAETDISGNTSAISQIDTRVTSAEGSITSLSQDVTTLQADLTDAEGDITANSGAITSLATRVTSAEGNITSQAQDLTTLQADLSSVSADLAQNYYTSAEVNETLAPLAGGTVTAPLAMWTNRSEYAEATIQKPEATQGSIVADSDFGAGFEFSSSTNAIFGPAFPQPFAVGRAYKITAKIKVVADGSTGGVDLRIGATTQAGTTRLQQNIQTATTSAEVADGLVEIVAYASTDAALLTSLNIPAAQRIVLSDVTSAAANYIYFHVRQNYANNTDGRILVGAFEISDVTAAYGAVSEAFTQVSTTVAGNTATISQHTTSIDGIMGEYTVKLDNNGHVSGMVLRSELDDSGATVSDFAVVADKFAIVGPGDTPETPFVVYTTPQTIAGRTYQPGVYMPNVVIEELTLTNGMVNGLYRSKQYTMHESTRLLTTTKTVVTPEIDVDFSPYEGGSQPTNPIKFEIGTYLKGNGSGDPTMVVFWLQRRVAGVWSDLDSDSRITALLYRGEVYHFCQFWQEAVNSSNYAPEDIEKIRVSAAVVTGGAFTGATASLVSPGGSFTGTPASFVFTATVQQVNI